MAILRATAEKEGCEIMASMILVSSRGEAYPGTAQNLPKSAEILKVRCQPLPHHLDYQGKLVAARSDKIYSCVDKSKEAIWRESCQRNMRQLKECGFQSSITEPYKELGEVILNDNQLILEGLGQTVQENKDKDLKQSDTPLSSISCASVTKTEKTLSLHEKVQEGNLRLNEMRKGKSLSMLMSKEERKKQLEQEALVKEQSDAKKKQWVKAIEEPGGFTPPLIQSLTSSLSGFPAVADRILPASVAATALGSPAASSKSSFVDPSLYQSHASSKHKDSIVQKSDAVPSSENHNSSQRAVDSWLDVKEEDLHREQMMFSDYTVEMWFQKLATIVWILETMKAEKSFLCYPFAMHLNTSQPEIRSSEAYRAYELSIEKIRRYGQFEKRASRKEKRGVDQAALVQGDECQEPKTLRASGLRKIKSVPHISSEEVSLDVESVREDFSNVLKEHDRIVHEQLKAMDRDRTRGAKERICLLEITGDFYSDLKRMRRGVTTESTETARKRLFVNLDWFRELVDSLPQAVKENRYCVNRLERLEAMSSYIYHFTDAMSKAMLLEVLGTLHTWELTAPDVEPAIRYVISNIIYVSEKEYEAWLKESAKPKTIDDVRAVSKQGYKLPFL